MRPTEDLNVKSLTPIIAPEDLKQVFPAPKGAFTLVNNARRTIVDALHGRYPGLVALVGPCSIHDPIACMDYARRLSSLARELEDNLTIVMRVYFEKPRTAVGWKGLVSDPDLDGSNRISKGLGVARRLLCEINELGLPVGTETLSPINPQYFADLISWGGIGARTSQSQTHREMVSGLSFPVGIKNPTSGSLTVALDAMESSRHAHSFLGISHEGRSAIVETSGNPNVHLVLRGYDSGPNFSNEHVREAAKALGDRGLPQGIMVDCSHGNSQKNHERQAEALESVIEQVAAGEPTLFGFMLESFIEAGNQKLTENLKYGVSITDACIDWPTTEALLRKASASLAKCGGRKLKRD